MGKVYTRFQTKKAQKPYHLAGGTYLCGLYKGVPPRPPPLPPRPMEDIVNREMECLRDISMAFQCRFEFKALALSHLTSGCE